MAEHLRVRTKHADLSLEEVAGSLPGTGEVMSSVSHSYAMVWHAANGGNWDLAAHFLRRVRSLLRGLAITRPKYAEQIREFDRDLLEPCFQALLAEDLGSFDACYERAAARANEYHVATDHPYIRWRRPEQPPDGALDLSRDG